MYKRWWKELEANQNQNLDYDEEEVEDVEDIVVIEHVFKGNVADSDMRDSVEQKEAETVRQAMDSGNCDVVEEKAGDDTVVEGEVQGEDKRLVKLTGEIPCIICNKKDKHPKMHSLAEHLPWFTAPSTACWVCNKQAIQMGRLNFHAREHHHIQEKIIFEDVEDYKISWTMLMNGLFQELARLNKASYPEGLQEFINTTMQKHRFNMSLDFTLEE